MMHLKNLWKIYVGLFIISVIESGCIKSEDVPLEARTEDVVYDEDDVNGTLADQVLTDIYTLLPKGFNRIDGSYLDAATDDAVTSQQSSNIDLLAKGWQSPTLIVDDVYANSYTGIRRANLFLSNIDVVPLKADVKQYDKAEARFLRAMFYFELTKRYGGVPLIGNQVLTLSDNLNIPRASYTQCVQYIVNQCDSISTLLRSTDPFSTDAAGQLGRATKGAALALKARMLLYAASPLNNPNNDQTKWVAARDAAKAVIDLNYYALNASFVNAFLARNDKEVILAYQQAKNQALERANSPVGYITDLYTSSGGTSPTQELVDAFPTIKGLSITTDLKTATNATGYDPGNPYVNRDPRFNATIFFNNQLWLNRAVETFEGGRDRPGGALVQTKTGYYLRKFLPDLSVATNYTNQDHNFIIFRFAEVILNYAEALNETGNTEGAVTQINLLRRRAGITAGTPARYGIAAGITQAGLRDIIKLERRIELAFEEHRFWDIRRWKTAEVDFNKALHGVRITKSPSGSFTYQYVPVGTIAFKSPQMYLYPFAYSELLNNNALTQNPGW